MYMQGVGTVLAIRLALLFNWKIDIEAFEVLTNSRVECLVVFENVLKRKERTLG